MIDLPIALDARGFTAKPVFRETYYDTDAIRVVVTPEDGINVVAWATGAGYGRGVIAWTAQFDSNTPPTVILAAIDAVLDAR